MVNNELLEYIKESLKAGLSKETIKTNLLANGWRGEDVEDTVNNFSVDVTVDIVEQPKKNGTRASRVISFLFGKSRKAKIASFVVLVLALFVWVFPIIATLVTSDISPINDTDLRLPIVSVPDSDNAYFDLVKIETVLYYPEEKKQIIANMADGKVWDEQFAQEIISQNETSLRYFRDAAQKSKFQDPIVANPDNISPETVLPPLNPWRNIARLSALRAQYLAKQGKDKEAIDEALISINIGQKIQESQSGILEHLVGVRITRIGFKSMQSVVASSTLSGAELKNYAQELNKFYKNKEGLIKAMKAEYTMLSEALSLIVKGLTQAMEELLKANNLSGLKLNFYYFHPNETRLLSAEYMRNVIDTINKSCQEINITKEEKSSQISFIKAYFTENIIGKILTDVANTGFQNFIKKPCDEDTLIAATQVIIGIKAFKNDTGNYPHSLTELVPQYLPSIPIDPYDGNPLKYSAEKRIIYSVGPDREDLGGSTGDAWDKMPNPTFEINF